ncbi:Bis(5'-nucleosyl)-tetraphosphatase [Apiospora marii]|uniref:Bis(5'-adenosyl)-triphosphatase n=1 Tax=Apiospora marii TaxID=335849 RepID=A0ABR1S8Y2_9PEZI
MSTNSEKSPLRFGPFEVTSQVFYTTPYSFALVNLKPLLPGHVLVCPQKPHKRLTDLSAPELTDLMQAVQRVQRMLARHYFTTSSTPSSPGNESQQEKEDSNGREEEEEEERGLPEDGSFNIAIQDGAEAGQTVPHLHVHVIPRIRGATAKSGDGPGDKIYEMMADEHGNVGGALWDRENQNGDSGRPRPGGGFPRIEDADRQARSMREMEEEARLFRDVLGRLEREGS